MIHIGQTIQQLGDIRPSSWIKLINIIGVEHVEFDPSVFEDLEAVIPMIKKKSVTLHAPYYGDFGYDFSSKNQSEKVEEYIKKVQKHGDRLHAHSMVVHPPRDPIANFDYFLENINKIKMTVFLENMIGQQLSSFEKWYFDTKDKTTAKIGFCFDVPHSFITHGEESLFNIPESLLSDLKYIHISELTRDKDCHWPFGTEGGELPFEKFKSFIKEIKFNGTINMEMHPSDLKGVENLINSYLLLSKLGSRKTYLKKKIRVMVTKRLIMKKLRSTPLQQRSKNSSN